MKTLTDSIVVLDEDTGKGQTGKTVIYYPWNTTANGTTAVPGVGKGKYVVTIDPTLDNDKIAKYYDIYINGELHDEKVFIGVWMWFVKFTMDVALKVVHFSDASVKDENGESLPTTILNVKIGIMSPKKDLPFFISDIQETQFTIEASMMGVDELPVDVWLKIEVGES